MADINGNSRKKVEKLTMEEIADRLEGLKSSLDTIRRTASELIMGIDAQLQELQADKKVSRSLDKQADKEVQLLYGDTSQYGIYQLKDNPELRDLRFAGTAELLKRGILSDDFREIQPENYNLVYTGQFSDIQGQLQGEKLNALFEKFNIDHPADYKGHSLSVSDIVVLHENGKNSAHFVDSFGFTELPDFMHELTGIKEQEADKAENGFTDEEKQFLETDNASLIAKKFLAWDEMEDLGYRFFEDGYIDKFKPVEKALFGNGLVSDDTIHDIAHRMQGGEDIREELAKAFIGGYERVIGVGENDAVAVFGKDAVTVTFENAEKQVSYEEMGTAFLSLIESEYKDIEQARVADEQEEEIVGNATSEHDVNHSALQNDLKLEAEQTVIEQPASEQIQAEQPETQAEQDESTETPKLTDMEDGDEIIDLGDETEQVLADMKKILNDSKNTLGHTDQKREQTEPKKAKETKFAFQIADRFVSIQETESGYDYSIMDMDYKEVEGGVYENTGVDIQVIADDIVDDLREDRFENGAGGSISDDDEIIPIDFDELTESIANAVQDVDTIHKKEAEHIVPDILQGNIVENFKEKTNEFFHEICEMNPSEIEDTVKCHVQAQLDEAGIDAEIVDVAVAGSRCRGLERDGSDLDVVVELSTSEREDVLFDAFNGDALHIGRVKVDTNPITAQRTGTLETYLPQVEDYLEGVREAREKEPVSIFNIRMNNEERWFKNTSGLDAEGLCKAYADCDKPFVEMEKYGKRIEAADHAYIEQGKRLDFSIEFNEETDQITIFNGNNFEYKGLRETLFPEQAASEVTLTVAECGEFHNFGEFHEKIATVDEAIAKWKQIPPERMNGIPAIGINIHTPGTETYNDVITDILTENRFELDVLDYIPEIKGSPQAMEMIAELIAKLPDMKIEGNISEDLEAKLWEKRMPDLTPAEQLAVEIDRFIYSYDTNAYHDNHQSMTENVSEISEMIGQRDVEYLTEWLNEVISVENIPEKTQRANELLEKLAEYKPLAKIEEMEEQNYNMIDNILNNGVGEKAQKEENKKAQDKNAKPSLKARLAEKMVQVAGQGGDEIVKNQQRGI